MRGARVAAFRHAQQRRIRHFLGLGQRRVGLDHNAAALAVGDELAALQPRVHLDLIDGGRPHARRQRQLLEVLVGKVGHADKLDQTARAAVFQCAPRVGARRSVAGRVQQKHVDLCHAQLGQRFLHRGHGARVAPIAQPQLGGDEDCVARDARVGDRAADVLLVAIDLRRVHVAVAGAQCGQHGLVALAVRAGAIDAETKAGSARKGLRRVWESAHSLSLLAWFCDCSGLSAIL